jgi:UDP-glucose 4-epimerase
MAVCLVTGGAGFLGSHLVAALLARGHSVRVLDNFTTGSLLNLARVMEDVELYPGDLAAPDYVRQMMLGVDWVFHHASPSRWPDPLPDPVAARYADAIDTIHVLTAAREAQVRRVIFASSLRVYGSFSPQPITESTPPQPVGPYSLAKWTGEQACMTCTQLYGVETVRLRYFHVFGLGQTPGSPYARVVAEALDAMLAGRQPVLPGDGMDVQDLIHVDDAVHATLLAAEAPRVSGKVYNVARGRPTTGRAVVETLNKILGTQLEPLSAPARIGDDLNNVADTARAEAELGFCASADLERGLRRCLAAHPGWQGQPPHQQFRQQALSNGP